MKILHTADWHLGISLHKYSLIEDQRFFLKQLEAIIISENVDVIIIAGDIYDTTLASKEAIDVFNEAMRLLCIQLKKEVIIIAGNHDSQTRLTTCSELLGQVGLHIYGKIEENIKPLQIQNVDFYPIPYFHKESVARIYDRKLDSYEAAMNCVMDDVRKQRKSNKQIVIAHCFVNGASVCESDRFAMVGGSDLISADVFRDIDYVALGHLHSAQQFSHNVVYSGSPIAYSFSEMKEKQVLIIDSETMQVKACEVKAMRKIAVLKGNYDQLIHMLHEHADEYVKIILEDQSVNYEMLAFFRERAPYLLALSGNQASVPLESETMDVRVMDTLRDEEIVKQFFNDYLQRDISEEEMKWFEEAKGRKTECE